MHETTENECGNKKTGRKRILRYEVTLGEQVRCELPPREGAFLGPKRLRRAGIGVAHTDWSNGDEYAYD